MAAYIIMEDALIPYLDTRTLTNYGCVSHYHRDRCIPVVNARRKMYCLRIALLRYRYLQSFGDTIPRLNAFYFWRVDRSILNMVATLRLFNNAVEMVDELQIQKTFWCSPKAAAEIYGRVRKMNLHDIFICVI